MLTVAGLARRSGATPSAVRYYTRLGLLRPDRDPNNGYQLFQPRDVNLLGFIWQAKQLGYTLKEIRSIIQDADEGQSPCPKVRDILQSRIVDNRRRLEGLMLLQERMEQALLEWAEMPDGVPDGYSVCYLIEATDAEEGRVNLVRTG